MASIELRLKLGVGGGGGIYRRPRFIKIAPPSPTVSEQLTVDVLVYISTHLIIICIVTLISAPLYISCF